VFHKILVANRGEIARRIIRTSRRLGISTVAVHSDPDADAPHVHDADEAIRIGPAPAASSYLDIAAILGAAERTGAEAVHPGYGFLAENPDLAAACAEAGITFVGPRPETIRLMADKGAAKRHLAAAGVPTIPGTDDDPGDVDAIAAAAGRIGYPVLLKAAAGGGGKGMRQVEGPAALEDAVAAVRREARAAFGDDRLLVEKVVERPRHVEVQVFGDTHGQVIHLFERECSIQRRHQKIIEETPSPALDDELRAEMCAAAVAAARSVDYVSAGTVEMLLSDVTRDFHFLEMNTRLQVEHPVTEMVTGLDLVEWQLRVAAGEPLPLTQDRISDEGHAIEARLYAEDPAEGFLPQSGRIHVLSFAGGDGIRIDSGIEAGTVVSPHYDPMLAKVVAHGRDRDQAIERLSDALHRTVVLGVVTNLDHLTAILATSAFRGGRLSTGFLDEHLPDWGARGPDHRVLVLAALATTHTTVPSTSSTGPWENLGPWRLRGTGGWQVDLTSRDGEQHRVGIVRGARGGSAVEVAGTAYEVRSISTSSGRLVASVDGDEVSADVAVVRPGSELAGGATEVWLRVDGATHVLGVASGPRHADSGALFAGEALTAPMPGTVTVVNASVDERVAVGDVLLVVEAMKMEHPVVAPAAGVVSAVHVKEGDAVDADVPLVEVDPERAAEDDDGG
jgi:acetyl-CoA/propionyl-CoA carboxylase, biotin carboxylase, biotin carboxyl carrier protein